MDNDEEWLVAEEEAEAIELGQQLDDARWSLGHRVVSMAAARYPKTMLGTTIGPRFLPYHKCV